MTVKSMDWKFGTQISESTDIIGVCGSGSVLLTIELGWSIPMAFDDFKPWPFR